jgi:hypothetical protein
VDEDTNQIEAMRGSNFRPQNYHQNQQGQHHQTSQNNGPVKCTHCEKPGHMVEKCFIKFHGLRPQNQNNQRNKSNNQTHNNAEENYCRLYEKDDHSEDNCFSMQMDERKLRALK